MSFQLKNKLEIQKHIRRFSNLVQSVMIREMEIVVARLENHAKDNQGHSLTEAVGYKRTGNLVNSIGGVVLKDGIPVQFSGFGGGEGGITGKEFIDSIISNYGSGFVILIVAGMEYATYVENKHQLNVLKKSELLLPTEMSKMFNRIKIALNKA